MSETKPIMQEKSWDEFRSAGLLLIINSFLHIFGWAIVITTNDNGEPHKCFPARVRYRGFDEESVTEAYKNVSKYMKDNAEALVEETND